MMNYIEKKCNNTISKLVISFVIVCVFAACFMGKTVEAATTCSSGVSFPATTTSSVNMRKKAGTTYKSYGMLKKNQKITVLGYVKNGGVKWYKCKGKINGKNKTGYVSSAYVKTKFPVDGAVNKKVVTYLNVRKSASSTSSSLLKIKSGDRVSILGITNKSGKFWYKLKATADGKTKTGYVLGKYIDVTSDSATSTDNKENTNENKGYVNDKVATFLNVRKSASTLSEIIMKIPPKTVVTILSDSGGWYKVKVTYNNKTVTGYVSKDYITLGKLPDDTSELPPENNEQPASPMTEEEFQALLNMFPESYKPNLALLHQSYPAWKFVPVNTNLDWAVVIQNESVVGRNVIQSNYPLGKGTLADFSYLSTAPGAYDWSKDKYTVKDGTNWFSADPQVISYYMDPRNFLNDKDIFQFEALAYENSHNEKVVQSILNNTFMQGSYNVVDSATNTAVTGTYTQAFMDAGKGALANPYFLASRVKQEVGINGSNSTSGTYKGYEGIYNFYNIGANDGANAVANGLKWAKTGTTYDRPWTNPYKSIVGGAKYIAANYINKGQNTLYFQKFNVASTDLLNAPLYSHQYMTNVQAPSSEGRTTRTAYSSLNILGDSMVFYIPVYNNMPAAACQLPTGKGNPNPYLSSLTVNNAADSTQLVVTPTFTYNQFVYTMAVESNVAQVTVGAKTVSKYAAVVGTGVVNLNPPGQTTVVVVTGVAQNGQQQQYTINIVRKAQ